MDEVNSTGAGDDPLLELCEQWHILDSKTTAVLDEMPSLPLPPEIVQSVLSAAETIEAHLEKVFQVIALTEPRTLAGFLAQLTVLHREWAATRLDEADPLHLATMDILAYAERFAIKGAGGSA